MSLVSAAEASHSRTYAGTITSGCARHDGHDVASGTTDFQVFLGRDEGVEHCRYLGHALARVTGSSTPSGSGKSLADVHLVASDVKAALLDGTNVEHLAQLTTLAMNQQDRLSTVRDHLELPLIECDPQGVPQNCSTLRKLYQRQAVTNDKLDQLHDDLVAVKSAIEAQGPNSPGGGNALRPLRGSRAGRCHLDLVARLVAREPLARVRPRRGAVVRLQALPVGDAPWLGRPASSSCPWTALNGRSRCSAAAAAGARTWASRARARRAASALAGRRSMVRPHVATWRQLAGLVLRLLGLRAAAYVLDRAVPR